MASAAAAPVLPVPDQQHVLIPIDQIVSSPTNPRTHVDPVYIDELAVSIATKGVLQAILVRPRRGVKGAPFEIVAGECRWRASVQAQQSTVPAVVRELSDEEVLEFQLIENLHRKDLTDLEQAVGYRRLIDTNPDKHSAASLASRIGMSADWVWDTLSLNNLIPDAKTLLEEKRIARGHAVLIARQTVENQKWIITPPTRSYPRVDSGLWEFSTAELEFAKAAGEPTGKFRGLKPVSIRELDSWINDHIRFDVSHAAKALPMQFETTAAIVEQAASLPGRGKKVIAITHDFRVNDDAKDEEERTFGKESWMRADGVKSKTCEYSVLGVVVAGPGKGETLQVCVNRDKCTTHFGAAIKAREKNAKLRQKGDGAKAAANEATARARDTAKREAEQAAQQVWDKLEALLIKDAVEQLKATKTLTPAMAKAVLELDVFEYNAREAIVGTCGKDWFKHLAAALLIGAVSGQYMNDFEDFKKSIAKPFGLDLKRLEAIRDKHTPTVAPKADAKKKAKK